MSLKSPPIQEQPIAVNSFFTNRWALFFNGIFQLLSNSRPWQLPSYMVAGAPDATGWEGHIIYVSNESGGKTIAFSDGTNWRRVQDRVIIS